MAVSEPDVDLLDSSLAGGVAIRGGALRTLAYVASMLLSLASVPFMTRHLGTVDYGYFVAVSSIIFIIGGVTEAGLTYMGIREYAVLDGPARDRYLRQLVGLRLALTVVGVLVATGFTAVTGAKTVVVEGTFITGVGLLLTLTQQTYMVSLSARLKLGWVSALELLKHAAISVSMIALVIAGASLLPFFLTSVFGGIVILACTLLVLRSEAALLPAFDLTEWKRMLREVAPFALAAAVGLVYFRLAIILMSYIAPASETGIYGAAYRIVETVGVIPWLLVSSGFPILARAARDDTGRLRYGLQKLFEVSALLGAVGALCVAIGAQFAIDVVAGPKFQESVPVLRIQAIALFTSFFVATGSFALLSLKRYAALLIPNFAAAVTAAVATLVLVPPWGAEGAAVATCGAEAVLAVGYLISLWRVDRTLVPSFAIVPRLLPGVAAALAIGIWVPAHPVILVALAALAYFGLAFLFRAVPPELINAALRRDPQPDDA
jgi:O-antigen/teichoic acid export membrane protein